MRKFLPIVLLLSSAFGQVVSGRGAVSGSAGVAIGGTVTQVLSTPALPQTWVDNNELWCGWWNPAFAGCPISPASPGLLLTAPQWELQLPNTWITGPPTGLSHACTFHLPYWTGSPTAAQMGTGLAQAETDIESCRSINSGGHSCVILDAPPGLYTSINGFVWPQTANAVSNCPLVERTTAYASILALPEPVGAGGIQRNLSASTAPGLMNDDFTGGNMWFMLGPLNPGGSISGLTQVSVNTTSQASITGNGSVDQMLPLTNGYIGTTFLPTTTASNNGCASGSVSVDTSTNQECVAAVTLPTGTAITAASATGTTVTITTTLNPGVGNSNVLVSGMKPNSYNGTWSVTSSSSTQFQYTALSSPGAATTLGTASISPVGLYGIFTKNHVSGVAVTYNPDNNGANVSSCHGSGTFLLNNWPTTGACSNTANYNYLQYFVIKESTANPSISFQLCSPASSGSAQCAGSIGPDHVGFFGELFAPTPGNNTADDVFFAGQVNASSTSQWATDIHIRDSGCMGDWTSLMTGANAVTDCFNMGGISYWSICGSQVSQMLWPGNESHGILTQSDTFKICNSAIHSGYSIGTFAGGFSSPPAMAGFLPSQDVQYGRIEFSRPYSWLGMMFVPAANANWGGGSTGFKNIWERKSAVREVDYGINACCNDNSGGQNGISRSLDPRNSSAGTFGVNYQTTIQDVNDWYSVYSDTCTGLSNDSGSAGAGNGGGVGYGTARVWFRGTLQQNVTATNPGCGGSNFGWDIPAGSQQWTGNVNCSLTLTVNGIPPPNCTFGNTGGIFSLNGAAEINPCNVTSTSVTSNVLTVACGSISGQTQNQPFVVGESVTFAGLTNASDTFLNGTTVIVASQSTTQFTASYTITNYSATETGNCNAAGSSGTCSTAVNVQAGQSAIASPNTSCLGVACGLAANILQINTANNFSGGESVYLNGFNGSNSSSLLNNQVVVVLTSTPTQFTASGIHGSYASESENAGVANGPVGFQILGMRQNDPVYISGCTTSGINMPTQTINSSVVAAGIGPAGSGNAAWSTAGWTAANLTVTYPWTATQGNTGQSDTSGTCLITNIQGKPTGFLITHNGLLTDSPTPIGTGPDLSHGPSFAPGFLFRDSWTTSSTVSNSGWYNSIVATPREGTNTEQFNHDVTTLSAYKLVWPGRTNTLYTEYGNNANFPDAGLAPCTPPGCHVSPPNATGMYFPANTCGLGFNGTGAWAFGTCSGNAVPIQVSDYHQLQANAGSIMHATASDGTDIGPLVNMLDTAQTTTNFSTLCSCVGPFPD